MNILKTISCIAAICILPTLSFAKETGTVTGMPIPRFVVLKSQETNLRKGPNVKFPIVWTYKRKGYPMELVAEFENWRKLRDQDGSEGWVHENLITGVRNAMIFKTEYKTDNPMYKQNPGELVLFRYPDETSYPMIRAQIGVMGKIKKCQKEWCKVSLGDTTAWVLKSNLWGVYQDEIID